MNEWKMKMTKTTTTTTIHWTLLLHNLWIYNMRLIIWFFFFFLKKLMRHASANLLWFEIQFLLFHSMDGSLTPKKTRCNVVCRLHSNVLFIFVCLNRKIIDQPNMICSPPSKHQLTNWKKTHHHHSYCAYMKDYSWN